MIQLLKHHAWHMQLQYNPTPSLEDINQIARFVGVDYSFQCLYDSEGHISDILTGDVFSVHHEGIKQETENFRVKSKREE
jgi:nickel-dependent lactate racemase